MSSSADTRRPDINTQAGFNDYFHLSKHLHKQTGLQHRKFKEKPAHIYEYKLTADMDNLFNSVF